MIAEHFVLPNIDPVVHIGSLALQIGPLAVRWYALSYLLGIILGYIYAKTLLSRARLWQPAPPLSLDALEDLLLWLGLGIIVGGRVFYMLVYGQKELQENSISQFHQWRIVGPRHRCALGCGLLQRCHSCGQSRQLPSRAIAAPSLTTLRSRDGRGVLMCSGFAARLGVAAI